MSRVFISAAHKSSGKTTISIGLCSALAERGYVVQPFKKGPDYIDPLWLTQASGWPCYNLDFNTQTHEEIDNLWQSRSQGVDLNFIEGNKGLYDGVDPSGSDCNGTLAQQLRVPVVLVVDVQGITRGVAPLILGYQQFDPEIEFIGVILNKVASERHERKLRAAVETYTELPVLGAVYRHADLEIDERHLGLVPSNEHDFARQKINTICQHVEQQVDIDLLITLLKLEKQAVVPVVTDTEDTTIKIGIAQDSAFGFYYQDDMEAFGKNGAELVPFDLINDDALPEVDALVIGGGFPETHMQGLSRNVAMRTAVRQAVDTGLPVYAECGGLMYLCRQIEWRGQVCEMAGAIPADVEMHQHPQGRGYVRLQETGNAPWLVHGDETEIHAHEFHHSCLKNIDESIEYAYRVKRGRGIDGLHDGIIYRNTVAGYTHLRSAQGSPWVGQFVEFIKSKKRGS